MSDSFHELRDNIDKIMRATTPMDAYNLYDSVLILPMLEVWVKEMN